VIRCVIGLGNPGLEYMNTRHNIGFCVVDLLINGTISKWKKRWWQNYWSVQLGSPDNFICCKPATFMNLSGKAVYKIVKKFKLNADELLIIYDDVYLPLGKLRIRAGGSSGGHNGLQSIINYLETNKIPRLRIGIGEGTDNRIEHVLGNFKNDEMESVERMTKKAIEAIRKTTSMPWDRAIQQINTF